MRSLAQKIALQFSFVLSLLVILLAIHVIGVIGKTARRNKNAEISAAMNIMISAVRGRISYHAAESELPYYIIYTVYNAETKEITATNASFIPILPETNGKSVAYLEENFFTDGDLNIIYETNQIRKDDDVYIIQISNSIDRDAMTNLFKLISIKSLLSGILPLLIMSYFISLFIAKRTLKPIVKITKAAASISSSNLDAMLAVSSTHNELDALASTFNELFSRLKHDFIAVKAADSAKTNFLSNMSHEIRTPINAILGLDEMILRESCEPQIKNYAQDIQSSSKSLLSIINDILDFSKIEAGKLEIIPVDYDLSRTIADLVNMVSPRAHDKGLDFIVNIDETIPHKLHGDEIRIKQCIINLLTNAIKYTPMGSVTINISGEKFLDPTEKNIIYLRVQVIDTGIGIKDEDIQKLFSPFERIEERRNRTIEGTGLGMSIVKSLLSSMGSHLEVKSEYGKGSDFSFCIEQQVLDWEEIGNYEKMKEKIEKASYKESFQAPDARILVVDDTALNLTVIKGLLKNTRILIDTAESGFDALKMARETNYDIILIDHRMPKMDGIEMLHVLRGEATSKSHDSVCIALTANAISGAKEMYISEGFKDYLSKPVEAAKLEMMIAKYLPAEKVLHSGDNGFIEQKESVWDNSESRRTLTNNRDAYEAISVWKELFDIDIVSAIHNCSTGTVFIEAIKNFYDSIEEKASLIEQYRSEGNWNDYTVLVHALKSSSRLIGAEKLSAQAAFLEQCGDKAKLGDKEAVTAINEKTPTLIELFKSYSRKLGSLLGKTQQAKNLPKIDDAQLTDALSALKEVVSAYDFDSADMVISELEKYSMPVEFEEKYQQIKKAVQSVDQNEILTLLG